LRVALSSLNVGKLVVGGNTSIDRRLTEFPYEVRCSDK
jgi:hypothetical protein